VESDKCGKWLTRTRLGNLIIGHPAVTLLGFEMLTRELLNEIDFQDETLAAKLGAKVGGPEPTGEPEKLLRLALAAKF
jgi:hypothetical protein